jgi:hypothetical protein
MLSAVERRQLALCETGGRECVHAVCEAAMSGFEWVKARAECSIGLIFDQLKTQVQKDIDTRQTLSKGPPFYYGFRFKIENDTIIALVEGNRLHESVTLRLSGNAIEVTGKDGKLLFSGTVALNKDKECRLRVNGDELELWQFRKKALEDLLFSIPEDYMRKEEVKILRQN